MSYINYTQLYKKGLTDGDYHVLQKLSQKEANHIDSEYNFDKLFEFQFVKEVKKGKTQLERLRATPKGKNFLLKLQLIENTPGVIALCDSLIDLFEVAGVNIGTKRRVLINLNWLVSKSDFTLGEIHESIVEWLGNEWKMWLENVLWDRKHASIYTTINSRTLAQSPLYEFMRRKYEKEW